jgi:hypothetical protein
MDIYFIYNITSGSGLLRGKQIQDTLKVLGYNTFNTYDAQSKLLNKQCKKIKKSIIFIIKKLPEIQILKLLKQNDNIIIHDVLDYATDQGNNNVSTFHSKLRNSTLYIDYLITVNKYMKLYLKDELLFKKSRIFVIPHHYDNRIIELSNTNISNELNICYIGYSSSQNCMYLDRINDIVKITDNKINNYHTEDNNIYNCHFNIRDANSWNYKFKSCVKLATAAALNCNIITTRDNSISELLPDDYPYYTADTYDDVLKTIQYAKDTYNTPIWYKGLKQMADIKIKTSLDETITLYIQLLNKINDI